MGIGKLIHDRRVALGLTLEQVGDYCGVGKSTVRKWETGAIANMRRDKIALLANILRMDPIDFISEESETEPAESLDMARLEAMHQNPRLGLLFDHTAKMDSEQVDAMIQMSRMILKERDPHEG